MRMGWVKCETLMDVLPPQKEFSVNTVQELSSIVFVKYSYKYGKIQISEQSMTVICAPENLINDVLFCFPATKTRLLGTTLGDIS